MAVCSGQTDHQRMPGQERPRTIPALRTVSRHRASRLRNRPDRFLSRIAVVGTCGIVVDVET
jgi:hypothetical protein